MTSPCFASRVPAIATIAAVLAKSATPARQSIATGTLLAAQTLRVASTLW
jgi:hypothetical protein